MRTNISAKVTVSLSQTDIEQLLEDGHIETEDVVIDLYGCVDTEGLSYAES